MLLLAQSDTARARSSLFLFCILFAFIKNNESFSVLFPLPSLPDAAKERLRERVLLSFYYHRLYAPAEGALLITSIRNDDESARSASGELPLSSRKNPT